MTRRTRSDAESWQEFYRRAGRQAMATRVRHDDTSYFGSGARQVGEIIDRFAVPRQGTVLEIGCGDGRMALALADRYEHVYALDIAPAVLDACRRNLAGRDNVDFLLGGSPVLADLPAGTVDFVLSATVLQHVSDRADAERYLTESSRLLRPGGVAALQIRNPGLRSRSRDVLVDLARLFGHRLPSFHPSWRGARLTEGQARRLVGRDRDEVGWHVDGHHVWLVITAS